MKVLVAASSAKELSSFPLSYRRVVTGVGPVLAAAMTAKAISEEKPDAVFSVGSAGSMGELSVGACISFGSVIFPDLDLTLYGFERGETLLPEGKRIGKIQLDKNSSRVLMTSSAFSSSPVDFADAADMEAYGVALASSLYSVPCFACKVITDVVGVHITLKEYGLQLRSLLSKLPEKVEEVLHSF
ncbi:MAG: hypothetical protein IAA97_07775 [Spirochaetes bacterium]|uniref:Nucleoside phosphorylase domain-containing protein n=1 Tax=Candidatus Ornithospirochaeta stercoripullorum TaxID=2840899 RepID=A0A9D9E4C3_9SPIO|nr:hypothetical protein [Candidatus Ornithospirochaeta stercoripullorum]